MFDNKTLKYETINIKVLAHYIYSMSNEKKNFTYTQVKELALSGNQTVEELERTKIKWLGGKFYARDDLA